MPKKKLDKVRIDKWLWSVRIYKSRSQATEACKNGRIKIDDKSVKPSQTIERDTLVHVFKDGFHYEYKVVDLIEKRVGAPIAQQCYENLTPEDELHKYDEWYVGKGRSEIRKRGSGRPTKRERREIDRFKRDK